MRRKMTVEEIDEKYCKRKNPLLLEELPGDDDYAEDPFFDENFVSYRHMCIGPLTERTKGLIASAKGIHIPDEFADVRDIISPAFGLTRFDESGAGDVLVYGCNRPKYARPYQIGDCRRFRLFVTNRDAICRMILINGYKYWNGRNNTDNLDKLPDDEEWGIAYILRED